MEENSTISKPLMFNPLKHHKDYISSFMKKASPVEIGKLIDSINLNYIDIYTGRLSVDEISRQIITNLSDNLIFGKVDYQKWIKKGNLYQTIMLNDQSLWILREGKEEGRYVHIHPAKKGENTVRFKGVTLKTAYQIKLKQPSTIKLKLDDVNKARIQVGLSPVKKLEKGKGISRCWEFITDWW